MIGEHTIEFLRHRAVVGPHPGLDVRDRDPHLRRGERARQGGVRVAVDEHHVRALGGQQRRERRQHAPGLLRVGAAAEVEQVLGPRKVELVEEDLREDRVVVLARVDEHLVGGLAQPVGDRGGLHELRPVPDDG